MTTPHPRAGTPPADIAFDAHLARRLVECQHPDLADLPIRFVAEGWDNAVFRLGDRLALRLPRREIGARLILHEHHWLPGLAAVLPLPIPAPVRIGKPQDDYAWPWSVTPWFDGDTADLDWPRADQAGVVADFFRALHRSAPADAPRNPFRGVPLSERAELFESRVASLARLGRSLDPDLRRLWTEALAEPIDVPPTWIHGDPHTRNVLVRDGRLVAVIDWGDIAQGDRATDLVAIWLWLDDLAAREHAIAALPEVTAATWRRAKGWVILYAVMLLLTGLTDDPRMGAIAEAAMRRLMEGP